MAIIVQFSVFSEIVLPTGERFVVGTGAHNCISPGDVCCLVLDDLNVNVEVVSIGMRTIDRVKAGIEGLLVRIDPGDAPTLNGRLLQFRTP